MKQLDIVKEKLKKWFKISDLKTLGVYWCFFAASFIYWELFIKWVTGALTSGGYFFLCFVPAEALFFSTLVGWGKELVNRFLTPLLLTLLSVYYIIQVGYYKIFGSLLSITVLGMGGDAVGGFGWTAAETLWNAAGYFVLLLLPPLLAAVLEIRKSFPKRAYPLSMHLCALLSVALVWMLGVGALALGGTSRNSAYRTFINRHADTDTTAHRIGISATTVVEAGTHFFGSRDTNDSLTALPEVDPTTILTPPPSASDGTSVPASSSSSQEAAAVPPAPNILEEIDFDALAQITNDTTIKALCEYYGKQSGTMKNEYTGLCKDYNLVYICAESFWSYAIDKDATPTLWKMSQGGIVLNNYYNSFKNTTTNGEFAFLCSLWPDVSMRANKGSSVGSFPQSSDNYMPYGLGNVTADSGYNAYGYHNFKAYYYSRGKSHPNLGLQCKFMGHGMRFSTSWPASDLEMLKQSVDDYINDDKFVAYYMTFSGHGPYTDTNRICAKNRSFVENAVKGKGYSDSVIGYLACNRELDLAMEYLLERLEESGQADNTLIVITGDHYPYYISESTMQTLLGHKPDAFEPYKSTCIMYAPGLGKTIYSDAYCCNVDILPTVLNLLDVPYDSRMLAGTDIFSDSLHKAVLYNKSFITDMVRYDAVRGEAEWLIDVSSYSQEDLDSYIDAVSAQIDAAWSASLKTMSTDFYRFVWQNSGLHMQDPLPSIDTTWPSRPLAEEVQAEEAEGGAEGFEEPGGTDAPADPVEPEPPTAPEAPSAPGPAEPPPPADVPVPPADAAPVEPAA